MNILALPSLLYFSDHTVLWSLQELIKKAEAEAAAATAVAEAAAAAKDQEVLDTVVRTASEAVKQADQPTAASADAVEPKVIHSGQSGHLLRFILLAFCKIYTHPQ